jgi:hypothetical protein
MASMAAFQPHGLIRTPIQQQLYFRAHIANVYAGIANPKEPETVALMEVILYRNIFTEPYFIVNSQQPPTPTSDRRCDLVIRYLESGYEDIRTLLFAECKRTSTSQAFSLKALEKQALDYCQLHLKHEKDVSFVYAATMAGAHVRLWRAELDLDRLKPLWGPSNEGNWGQYKDVGSDVGGRELEYHFEQIKHAPQKLYAGQDFNTYGTSYQMDTSGASGFQAIPPEYQVATPSNQSSGYTVSYSAPSGASRGQYFPAPQTKPEVQTVQRTDKPFGDAASYSVPSGVSRGQYFPASQTVQSTNDPLSGEDEESQDDEEDEETRGGYQIGGDAETQETASSSKESKYHVVRVSKKAHTLKSDEYIFKNAKGKTRSTQRKDWQEAIYNKERVWKYSHYITYDLPK